MGFSASAPAPPAPPPPPPNPPTLASAAVSQAGSSQRDQARANAAGGFSGTLLTGPQGASAPSTAKQTLGGG